MSRPAIEKHWHAEAKRMREAGASPKAIGRALGVSDSSVAWCLDEDGYRERRKAAQRAKRNADPVVPARVERAPRQLINREALAKILAERRGDIPRDELMRAITL